MTILKRFLSLIITITMIAVCASCVPTETQNIEDTTKNFENTQEATTVEAISETETEDMSYTAEVDDVDFKGETISLLLYDRAGVKEEFCVERGDTGEPVNDAVYERNQAITDRINVSLEYHSFVNVNEQVTLEAKTHSGAYQIFTNMSYMNVYNVFAEETHDLSLLDYIDFDKKYWSQGFRDVVTFGDGDSQYLITGSPALTMYRYMYITIFNKDEFEARGWESLYDVVDRGDWTLEYQANLVKDSWVDTDEITGPSEHDFYGLVSGSHVTSDGFLVASGIHLVKKDNEGKWFWDTTQNESIVNVVEAVRNLFYEVNGTYTYPIEFDVTTGLPHIIGKFVNRECAMASIMLENLESSIGLINFDYGIAPLPKYSSGTDVPHRTYVQDQVTSIGVIGSVDEKDFKKLGAYIELLGQYSYEKVLPEYYERTLSKKFMSDVTSKRMLELIVNSVEFDFSAVFSGIMPISLIENFRSLYRSKNLPIGSSIAKWAANTNRNIDKKVNDKIEEINK